MANKIDDLTWIKAEIAILELKRAQRGLSFSEKEKLMDLYKFLQRKLPFEEEEKK